MNNKNRKDAMKLTRWYVGLIIIFSLCYGQESNFLDPGANARVGTRFLLEVPLNNITFNMLTDGRTVGGSLKHILSTKGIRGLYSGLTIEMLRSLSWYPRMWALQKGPDQIAKKLDCASSDNLISHLSAASIAGVEVFTMPLYRIQTAFMVEKKETIKQKTAQLIRTLYTGAALRVIPLFFTWDTFLLGSITI